MFQLMEAPEFITICVHFSSSEIAQRFLVFLGKDRPEFEDEVEPEYLTWFELLNDWPYPRETEIRDTGVCVSWVCSWLNVDEVDKLNQLAGVRLVALFIVEKGVEHADESEFGEEDPQYGFYYRCIDGQLSRLKQGDNALNTGYVLKYGDESDPIENLWALRESDLKDNSG